MYRNIELTLLLYNVSDAFYPPPPSIHVRFYADNKSSVEVVYTSIDSILFRPTQTGTKLFCKDVSKHKANHVRDPRSL